MEKTVNFSIDYKKSNFSKDYKLYLKDKYKNSLKKLVIGLILAFVLFLILRNFTNWKIIISIGFGLIVLIANFIFFNLYHLVSINKRLENSISEISFGKMNLTLESTFIELNQYGRKTVIFTSQIEKCIIKFNAIFFIEKNKKYLPIKINKAEMKEDSFEKLIDELKSLNIIIE